MATTTEAAGTISTVAADADASAETVARTTALPDRKERDHGTRPDVTQTEQGSTEPAATELLVFGSGNLGLVYVPAPHRARPRLASHPERMTTHAWTST